MATNAKSNATLTGTKTSKATGKTTDSLSGKAGPSKTAMQLNSAQAAPSAGMGRFFKGMIFYVIGSYIVQIGLFLLDAKIFHGRLNTTYLFTLPIFGKVNIMALIFIPFLILLLWALYKFKILPTQAELRAQAMSQAAARNGGRPSAAPAPMGSGIFARLRDTFMPASAAAPLAKSTATAKGTVASKGSSVGKSSATSKPSTTGKTSTTTTRPIAKTGTATVGANAKATSRKINAVGAGAEGDDDLYQRVRAQQSVSRKRRKH